MRFNTFSLNKESTKPHAPVTEDTHTPEHRSEEKGF